MSLLRVPIYPTRNLAVEIDPGARSIVAGTGMSFTTNADGSITINATGGTGTVTSVGATGSTGLTVGGSPITTSGTLTFTLSANLQSWSGIAPTAKLDNSVINVTDWDVWKGLATASGVQFGSGLGSAANDPSNNGFIATLVARNGNAQSVIGTAYAADELWYARKNTTWGNWVRVWDSVNFDPTTKADLASPVFTGDPRAPTPATADNDTSIATTAFVKNQGYATTASLGSYVLKAGDTMTGALFINNGGLYTRNAGQVKVYDSNNDTPIELGLGFGSGTDRNGYLWNRNNGFLSFGVNNSERMRISPTQAYITGLPFQVMNGDIYTFRTGGTTGVIFLNQAGTKYLYNDGTRYQLPTQGLQVGGPIYSDSRWLEGTSGGEGFQIVWNTVQAGQGRTEFINNRGGGSGGFTWWDRANTGAGTGTALAALTGAGLFVNGVVQFNTGGTSIGQLTSWPGNSNYVSLGTTTMGGTEYALLTANPSVDTNTYISSPSGGTVRIRPSANSTVGEANFTTSGLQLAKYVWPDANTAGSKKLSRISIGTAAPSGLIDGELYLRY